MRKADMKENSVVLLGLGRLGQEHYKAMKALEWLPVACLGRSESKCSVFENTFSTKCICGGLNSISQLPHTTAAVVAVSHEQLVPCTLALLDRGCKHILLEKPGALNIKDIGKLYGTANEKKANVFIAYNRRFYDSVKKLKQEIEYDGELLSCHFEFNELGKYVLREGLSADILKRWGIINSTHVIDLAFHLSGKPDKWMHYISGNLSWHPSGAIFVGSGLTEKGIMFSYSANWQSAGRWGLEFATNKRRFFLRPLEELKVQTKDGMEVRNISLCKRDDGIKEGIFGQMQAFKNMVELGTMDPALCTLEQAFTYMPYYETIFGYEFY